MCRQSNRWLTVGSTEFDSAWPIIKDVGSFLVIFASLISGCATTDDRYHGLDTQSRYYRVREGDTLYGISKRVGREFHLIATWNGLSAPYRIFEGQIIRLVPPSGQPLKKTDKKKVVTKTENAAPPPVRKKSRPIQKNLEKKLKVSWHWPLNGVIAKNYSQTGGKGLDIVGKFGEPVRAAADGKIVYCGQGLIGYGNLVIVKHNAHFLSAYGNNSRLLVKEGDDVKMGQQIAKVGMGTNRQPMLHFEIRKDGKPVNPIQHLPKP